MWSFYLKKKKKNCAIPLHEHLFLQFCNDSVPDAWLLQFSWQDTKMYVGIFYYPNKILHLRLPS